MLKATHEVQVASRNCQVIEEVLLCGDYLLADDNTENVENFKFL